MTPSLPPPSGPHAIGMVKADFAAGSRRAQAYVWYPAVAGAGPPRRLNTPDEARAFASVHVALGLPSGPASPALDIETNAVEGAAPLPGPWPLVVFNHGGALDPLANSSLMEALSSEGYVAASLGHVGESAGLVADDGVVHPIDPGLVSAMQLPPAALAAFARFLLATDEPARRRELAAFRAQDPGVLADLADRWATDAIGFVDQLLGNSLPRLRAVAAAVDRGRLAYTGMSLGGAAAFAACRRDPRARAGVNLDGTLWDFDAIDCEIGVAFLDIGADAALRLPAIAALAGVQPPSGADAIGRANDLHLDAPGRRGARPDIVRLEIAATHHADFTDRPLVDRLAAAGGDPSASPILSINALCRAFLDWTVKGAPRDEFDRLVARHAGVRRVAPVVG